MIRGSGCSKSRLAKAVGAEVAVEHRNEKWHAAVARSKFVSEKAKHPCAERILEVPMYKRHAAVARSTFVRQNVEKFRVARAFWKIRSGKIARRCGAKHISKSKCAKHLSVGRNVEVQI